MSNIDQMRLRQGVLADFGDFALRSDSLDEVLNEACRLVSEALNTDFAKILEIEKGGEAALVRAGIGWRPGIVGNERLSLSEQTSEAYSLKKGVPVVSRDIREEDRFEFASLLIEHGVVSLVNVPIFLPGGKAYGLLQVDNQKPREFGDRDTEFLRTYATILGPVIDRLHKIHSLEGALETNKRLLQELQHRVKNHIGIIGSMVRARARHTTSEEAREELVGVGKRIETLHLVHEQLYQSGTSNQLRLRPFLTRLVECLCRLQDEEGAEGGIRLKIDIADVDLASEAAVPIGLIANEFVANSLKHAFGDKGGMISVSVEATGDYLHLCFRDDGKGLPSAPDNAPKGSGTGINLIEGLARQLGAELAWSASETGTCLRLEMHRDRT